MFAKALLFSALSALAAAQSTVLFFTHVPNPITDGQAAAITYSTNDTTTPATIILRKGQANNLQTVETLTTKSYDGSFVWTPPKSLPDGVDYALEIKQGSQVNYFGPFVIQGASANAGSSTTSMAHATGSGNSTKTTSASMGTATTMHRNTTMMKNHTMTKTTSTAKTTKSIKTTSVVTTSSTGAGFQATQTGSGNGGKPNAAASLDLGMASSLVMGLFAVVGMVLFH